MNLSYLTTGVPRILNLLLLLWLLSAAGPSRAATVIHLRFDESGGNVASDSAGNFDGQLSPTGAAFVAGGKSGNAIRLNSAQNGYVNLGAVIPTTNSSFSIAAWVKVDAGFIGERAAVFSKHLPGNVNGYFLMVNASGGFSGPGRVSFWSGSDGNGVVSSTTVNDGQWHQVVGVYDASGSKKVYVDGTPLEQALNAVPPAVASSARVLIGGFDENGILTGYFSGLIDEVMFFDAALTDSEIDFLFSNPGIPLGGTSAPVAILPPGGLFTNSVQVVLVNNLAGSELRYTLDGTPPLATSPRYTESLTLTQRTEVRAQAFLSGFPITGASTNALFERVYAVNDGVPNTWRFEYFGAGYVTDPRVGAAEDPDGDGSTNYEEYLAGTHPLDPLSGFALTIRLLPELRWEGVANARYSVLRRDSLSGTNFTQIGQVTGTNGVAVFLDEGRPLPEGYYLLRLAP